MSPGLFGRSSNPQRRRLRLALLVAALAVLAGALASAGVVVAKGHRRVARPQCRVRRVCVIIQHAGTTLPLTRHRGGSGFTPLPRPTESAEVDQTVIPPQGRLRIPKRLGPPIVISGPLTGGGSGGASGNPTATAAATVPKGFVNSDLGIPPDQGAPQEPTAAEGQNVVWYTGNDEVALSTDAGKHFTYFNPSTILPDDGLSFCCDQVVSYVPKYNMFVWVLQYWCGLGTNKKRQTNCKTGSGNTSNRERIAVANAKDLVADAAHPGLAWTYWNLTPKSVGNNIGNSSTWFDQNKLGINKQYVNWSIDVLDGNVSTVMLRVTLSQLASLPAKLSFRYITDNHQKMEVAQGLTTSNSYFVGNTGLGTERIWSWPPLVPNASLHTINHATVPIFNGAINGSDGDNWYQRWGIFPGGVESATLSGSTLYVVQGTGRDYCVASCSSATPTLKQEFKQPAIYLSKYDVNTWTLLSDTFLYDPSEGLGWPELDTDGAGDVGITFLASKPGNNPQPVVSFLTPGTHNPYLTAEPQGLPDDVTGDYYSLRPGRTNESFVSTAQTVFTGDNMHWQYLEWGRGAPPPS